MRSGMASADMASPQVVVGQRLADREGLEKFRGHGTAFPGVEGVPGPTGYTFEQWHTLAADMDFGPDPVRRGPHAAGARAPSRRLHDEGGDHAEHAVVGLDVVEDVAVPDPRAGVGRRGRARV